MQTSFTLLPPFSRNPTLATLLTLSTAEAEHRLWKAAPANRFCQALEATCHILLILSGIALVLYSAAMCLALC
ncbi:MAG TPA: hypothetical protein VGD78_12700 [Chthoniobacterales bacterium]